MSASSQSSTIDVELPNQWEDQIDDTKRENIHQTTQRVDNAFRKAGFKSDLESVRVKDTGETAGQYQGRSEDNPTQAVMDIASDNSERKGMPDNAQDETYAHELGHEYFRSIVSQLGDEQENNKFEEIWQNQPSVFMTLNEAFADLTALEYNESNSRAIERNPFREGYKAPFQGLEKTFNVENREKELEILEDIEDDVEEDNYQAIGQKIGELDSLVADVDFRGAHVCGKQYNVFLVGMDDFFTTNAKDCTAVNENQIGRFADYADEFGEINPVNLTKHTHGSYDDREVINKAKEVLGIENNRRVGKGSIERPEEKVEQHSDEILNELILDRLEPTIKQVEEQAETVESEDVGEYVFDRLEYDKYGSSDGRVNEDMDLPHEVGGVIAETLYENDVTPINIAENPMDYAEFTREAIKETIRYGVETLRGSTDQEFADRTSEDYKNRLEDLI